MIDYFALGLTHFIMALAALRLMARGDLDREPDGPEPGNDNDQNAKGRRPIREMILPGQLADRAAEGDMGRA